MNNNLQLSVLSHLSAIPAIVEWSSNFYNQKTRQAYQSGVSDFVQFTGIRTATDLENVGRGQVIAWRLSLESRGLTPGTINRKLSALSSLFDYLLESQTVSQNPVRGVRRPRHTALEGKTPALSEAQVRALLNAPPEHTLKGKRDRAILTVLAFHGLRREELCRLKVSDLQLRHGVQYFRISGKGLKIRYLPVHARAETLLKLYLGEAGHANDLDGPLFRPVRNRVTGELRKSLHPDSVLKSIVQHYAKPLGLVEAVRGLCVHSLRATAATNALRNGADIAMVQMWLGHANISTTRLYDRRGMEPEQSPTYKIAYDE